MRGSISRVLRASPLAALAVALALPAAAFGAATFTVTTTTDAVDATPGNGVCATTAAQCSLRAAVQEANAAPGSTIFLPAGSYPLTLNDPGNNDEELAASGDLDITATTALVGAGASTTTITAATLLPRLGNQRLIETLGTATNPAIDGVTLTGGLAGAGSGILHRSRSLSLTDVALTGNGSSALVSPGSFLGGGIATYGELGPPTGPAPLLGPRSLTLSRSTIANNGAISAGAGIASADFPSDPSNPSSPMTGPMTVTITDSTISGNVAAVAGGGLALVGVDATLTNTTVSGNSAGSADPSSGSGGGLIVEGSGPDNPAAPTDTVAFEHSTLFGNTATHIGGGNITNDPARNRSRATFADTIVAGGVTGGLAGSNNCSGNVASLGYNLDDGFGCAFVQGGDLSQTPADLSPLAFNGGPTKTHALLASSYAIDAANPFCSPPTDQRGLPRPYAGIRCDIGSYESPFPAAPRRPGGGGGGGGGGGEGDDGFPGCQGKAATILGSDGPETLRGTRKADVIVGLGGDDKIKGRGGADLICGGAGDDKIKGGAGKDRLIGEAGNDLLVGGPGRDLFLGGPGRDTIVN
jgi:CSLREA domain-containing protein